MRLRELIDATYLSHVPVSTQEAEITGISMDSRTVEPGHIFVALAGSRQEGARFIPEALKRGARAVIVDSAVPEVFERRECLVPVNDARNTLTEMLRRFHNDPGERIRLIAVTGTNGKTTITYLLESIFKRGGRSSGVIGTVNHRFGNSLLAAGNTTPGIVENYRLLTEMIRAGMHYGLMEVSSHALDQGRVAGLRFRAAVFTNLTQDHLDYHKNEEDYFLAKARLFTGLEAKSLAVINMDDARGGRLAGLTKARVRTYGIRTPADLVARDVHLGLEETTFRLAFGQQEILIRSALFGRHNVYNILAAAAVALEEGMSPEDIRQGVADLAVVPGRMERVRASNNFHVFIDYAHTDDALRNVLQSVREVFAGRIILVFGCGGDRDKGKRFKMGQVAGRGADAVIITNDNPRSEDPGQIAGEIVRGCGSRNFKVILNRRQAIAEALHMAAENDIVLIAGKGHEDYQIFKDRIVPFREKEIVQDLLKELGAP